MNPQTIIIGGGLAGLTAGIHLAKQGTSVLLFEKEKFPRHKVCGEYVSKEILPYLAQLDIPLQQLHPKQINRLLFSTVDGQSVESKLPLGGLGISRYAFDNLLYQQALSVGVEIVHDNVISVAFDTDQFEVTTEKSTYTAPYVLGAFGKRSLLDKKLGRRFFKQPAPWLAVKDHYKNADFPDDLVALHNFPGGYCGLSRTETGAVNLCYLATYNSFRQYKNPAKYQELVLRKNPHLRNFLDTSTSLFDRPLSIARISFGIKPPVENHLLFLGDAAGLIHPLCGNGMAMAIHSAKIAAELLLKALKAPFVKRQQLEKEYEHQWHKNFKSRMKMGKRLQGILMAPGLSALSTRMVTNLPFLLPQLIKRTHGNPLV